MGQMPGRAAYTQLHKPGPSDRNHISTLPNGLTVITYIPGHADYLKTMYQMERRDELRVLCDPRVQAAIDALGINLCSFNNWDDLKNSLNRPNAYSAQSCDVDSCHCACSGNPWIMSRPVLFGFGRGLESADIIIAVSEVLRRLTANKFAAKRSLSLTTYGCAGDPWELETSNWEHERYARLLAILDQPRYGRVLEIGCGGGTFYVVAGWSG